MNWKKKKKKERRQVELKPFKIIHVDVKILRPVINKIKRFGGTKKQPTTKMNPEDSKNFTAHNFFLLLSQH